MASSPTSSCKSSYSASFPSWKFAHLPIRAMREKIIDKIMENRVTLIVGETGCGKSSHVPLFLLEEDLTPVICTQPRRFAVVAVAKMVAKALQCEVGDEVGYHIGHSKVVSARSKIIFKTAGVLLDEMRDKGLHALKYKVIILDEVHERSVESDLVLVCVKQFLLKNRDMRLVLMSATADITRYRDYFKDLGKGERVEVLAIPSSSSVSVFQREVFYLEQVTELLRISSDSSESLSMTYCSGPAPSMASADMKPEVHKIIHALILHIHENESDIQKSILIFLPTYYTLEQQWFLLKPFSSCFKVHILHSSIDTEHALSAMKIWKSHRKVILATNIAESSVTIPEVAYVIDSCRSLQVYWDNNLKKEAPELVWVSKSQSEQRKGRTGRTCDGLIYRLVTGSFYGKLQEYEFPAILRLSLRLQVLSICCGQSKFINDPKVLLRKALDPPDPEIIDDALNLLVQMKALQKMQPRLRYDPTFYGRLLASFSLSFDASVLILKFGSVGILREGILLGILMDTQPLPILRPFGQDILFTEYTDSYYVADGDNAFLTGKKEVAFMANLCAYQFWQRVFKDKIRLEDLKCLLDVDGAKASQTLLPKTEEEWCFFHNLIQSSLHQISEIYDDILSSLHQYRPKFLATSAGLPLYYDPYEFRHTCLLQCQPSEEALDVAEADKHDEIRKCLGMPFVSSGDFQTRRVAEKFADVVKEIRVEHMQESINSKNGYVDEEGSVVNEEALLCKFFLKGLCKRSTNCLFSHSLQAKRPVCKFFTSLQGCRYGDSCSFSHDVSPSGLLSSGLGLCTVEDDNVDASALAKFFNGTVDDGSILILDDTDLHFSANFSQYCDPSKIICTTSLPETSIFDPSLSGVKIMWGLQYPCQSYIFKGDGDPIPWNEVKCVLWFPSFGSYGDDLEGQKRLLQIFFEYLAIQILANTLCEVHVVVTMNNIRFSLLQVEKLGRDSFFFLKESFPFDESSFGLVPDALGTNRPLVISRPISYVFDCHPPCLQSGDYSYALSSGLYSNNK
ncbi:hypothetical protein Nepgr_022283 [Nepenthes gracilis]|uniref:RNA helicase n=1 Tax=Nepenthes gracilis TaxID=150966 RepID=A0AAD3XWN3_NEPGR|nr:hypothetical protein Nepgr_022283 [Nepenthes gracilis]